jgi:hypothetical protein
MSDKRIDILRQRIYEIGSQQEKYWKLFPSFADKICEDLSSYLGQPGIVRLTTAGADFSWDIEYREAGLELEGGRFRIPLMIRFDNLHDSGYLVYRFFLFCTISDDALFISLNDGEPFDLRRDNLEKLYSKIYSHLLEVFSSVSFFEEYTSDYRHTKMGFRAEER